VIATPANQSVRRLLTQQRRGAGGDAKHEEKHGPLHTKMFFEHSFGTKYFPEEGKADCDLAEATIAAVRTESITSEKTCPSLNFVSNDG
jgi:hypothetical protein